MNYKRFRHLLILVTVVCMAVPVAYYFRQADGYALFCRRIAKADHVVATFGPSGPSITITGGELSEIIRAIKSARRVPEGVGPKLLILASFYSGTNSLGEVGLWGGWFLADGHQYHARDSTLDSLVTQPLRKAMGDHNWNGSSN
jgi:hypothetical protein